MFQTKISVATYEFGLDLKKALHTAMEMRAEGVQFDLRQQLRPQDYGDTARRQLQNYLSERNLVAASAHFPLRSSLFEFDRLEERLNAIRIAMSFAAQLRIRQMTLRLGRLPERDSEQYSRTVMPVMNDLAQHGNREGVTLSLIPAGNSHEDLAHLITQVKTGPLSVDADLGAWVMAGRRPQEKLRALNSFIGQVEIRDAIADIDGSGQEVPVGRGEIDWDEIAALIHEMEFSGWLNVRRSTGNDKIGDASRAIQYLRNLMPFA